MQIGDHLSDRLQAVYRREEAKAAIGNLTLLHYGVNRSLQNREFLIKHRRNLDEELAAKLSASERSTLLRLLDVISTLDA